MVSSLDDGHVYSTQLDFAELWKDWYIGEASN